VAKRRVFRDFKVLDGCFALAAHVNNVDIGVEKRHHYAGALVQLLRVERVVKVPASGMTQFSPQEEGDAFTHLVSQTLISLCACLPNPTVIHLLPFSHTNFACLVPW
jgi:hypothetical protein